MAALTASAPATLTLRLQQPTTRRCLNTVVLRADGVIDDQAREFFGYLKCHLLACALHEATGWPLTVLDYLHPIGEWRWGHLGVTTPAGDFLDIDGPCPAGQVEDEWADFTGYPTRTRTLPDFDAFARMVGLPDDTPLTWWRTGQFTPEHLDHNPNALTDAITAYASHLLRLVKAVAS